jgi:hypothetical protein
MALSPLYNWPEPDNSSLVKNGAQDIRALGDAIDTSVWNVGFGQAGKNKIINGDFGIWQRGTSFTAAGYTADRFDSVATTSTFTCSQQAFTPGTAPVSGYESTYFIRHAVTTGGTAGSRYLFQQRVEDVRTYAGQTVTFSFWAKADAAKNISPEVIQSFGAGGSASVLTATSKQAITTSWARYSFTISVPSVTGKTIGAANYVSFAIWLDAGSDFNSRTNSLGNQSGTFDFWGVQVERGSKATPFQTASGGSPQAELAMCQRYYYRAVSDSIGDRLGWGGCNGTTDASVLTTFPVIMRAAPTALEQSGTAGDYSVAETGGSVVTCSAVPTYQSSTVANASTILTVTAGLIATRVAFARATNATAYLGWSAEL